MSFDYFEVEGTWWSSSEDVRRRRTTREVIWEHLREAIMENSRLTVYFQYAHLVPFDYLIPVYGNTTYFISIEEFVRHPLNYMLPLLYIRPEDTKRFATNDPSLYKTYQELCRVTVHTVEDFRDDLQSKMWDLQKTQWHRLRNLNIGYRSPLILDFLSS